MENIFKETLNLDKKLYAEYFLSEDTLMENAGTGVSNYIKKKFPKGKKIVVLSGSGNNGADGIVVARQLYGDYNVKLYLSAPPKSELARLQMKRALAVGVDRIYKLEDGDIIVDALFGAGFKLPANEKTLGLFRDINKLNGYKIAIDIPSGLDENGNSSGEAVKCDHTVVMGAKKISLFSDEAKDLIGTVEVVDLGVSKKIYGNSRKFFTLEKSDLKLPHRTQKGTHKGDYGHVAILSGDKEGASTLSSLASQNFGSGLNTLVSRIKRDIPYEIMQSRDVPKNSAVIVAGMGLGNIGIEHFKNTLLTSSLPLVLDADILHDKIIFEILNKRPDNLILTPHPKEFVSVLQTAMGITISVSDVIKRRVELVTAFSEKYPNSVLFLKGANRIIGQNGKIYIDTFGSQNLAKGGSGDVLAGMIGALVAQHYSLLDTTISASLAHSFASQNYKGNSFSFTPMKLIEELSNL
ncbi:yjeF-like protein, hydroxyethylthiazole kinase-related [Thiovulum sp. ES]|nr:yjeF-like protein, hydroxyethylthiazole kinase-related [Thiovulum sp. ES]